MRRIKKASIKFISLVPAGANKIEPVYKADGSVSFGTLIKADSFEEKGELTAVVYAPNLRDSQGDVADAEVVKQMAYDFIANGASIDINHDNKPVPHDRARVAETFIVQKTDERFHGWTDRDGNPIDLTGAWATVIKIDDPDLRKKYKNGDWAGVSMGGTAIVEQEKADVEKLVELLTKAINPPNPNQQPSMTPQDLEVLKTALKEGFDSLAKAIVPTVETKKADAKPADDTPVFKGDASNDRHLELHARAVQLHHLKKAVKWDDAESIRTYREAVSVLKAEWKEADDAAGIVEETAVQAAKQVRKAGPAEGKSESSHLTAIGVAKSDQDLLAAGAELAESFQKSRVAKTATIK